MNYIPSVNPILSPTGQPNFQQSYNMNPSTRLTIEQQNYLHQQQQYPNQNDPYTSGSSMLRQCSDLVRSKISQDSRYTQIDRECESAIQQYVYASVIPQILNSQEGRILFERWEQCIKELKQEYSKEEVAMTQNLNALLQDEVVRARLKELQDQQKSISEVAG